MMAPTMSRPTNAFGICFRKRDQGDCDRAGCPYNHDDKAIAAARAEKGKQGKGGSLGKARPTPNAFQAWGEQGDLAHAFNAKSPRKGGKAKGGSRERSAAPYLESQRSRPSLG